ncbi:hypothetical protein CR513_40130, partial [Mucuna pruriens]
MQILREICHTSLMKFPLEVKGRVMGQSRGDWCDFHRAFGHSTEGCWTLKTQLEKLIQEGHLSRYVQRQADERREARRVDRRQSDECPFRKVPKECNRSQQGVSTRYQGTIATISGGRATPMSKGIGE